MSAPHAARVAQPRTAEGDPQNFAMLPGTHIPDIANIPSEQGSPPINPLSLGVGLNACQRALNELGWPASLHSIWPTIRQLGIRDDRSSGRFLDMLQVADVNPCEGGHFEFAAESGLLLGTVASIVFPAFDELGETIDVAAWHPENSALALWHGVASMLGAENIFAPRLDEPLLVHETALDWLCGGRRGVLSSIHSGPRRCCALRAVGRQARGSWPKVAPVPHDPRAAHSRSLEQREGCSVTDWQPLAMMRRCMNRKGPIGLPASRLACPAVNSLSSPGAKFRLSFLTSG